MSETNAAAIRRCRKCQIPKPAAQFRRRRKEDDSSRVGECLSCHAQAEQIRRLQRRGALNQAALKKFALALRDANSDRQVAALVDAMLRRFGGVARLTRLWARQIKTAKREGDHRTAFLAIDGVVRLLVYCSDRQPPPITMTDEELDHEIRRTLNALLAESDS